jgi:deoxyribodipyrimidine photo-lyase
MSTALVWFRRDLRLHDHPALRAARDGAERLVCVFCFDDILLGGRHASGPRTQFMLECLHELDEGLRARGSRLFVRHGNPAGELAALAAEVHADSCHFSADVGPFARRRQQEVKRALQERHVKVVAHPGLFAVDRLEPIRTRAGDPYTVFTPRGPGRAALAARTGDADGRRHAADASVARPHAGAERSDARRRGGRP